MIETDRYTFDGSTGLTADAIEKVIAGINADYPHVLPENLEMYVNNRIKNTMGKEARFVLKDAVKIRNDEKARDDARERERAAKEAKKAAEKAERLSAFRKVSTDLPKGIDAMFNGSDRAAIQKALEDAFVGLAAINAREKTLLEQIAAEKFPLEKIVNYAEKALAYGMPGDWPFSRSLWNVIYAPKSKWKWECTAKDDYEGHPVREHAFVKTIKGGEITSITFTVFQRLDVAGFYIITDRDHVEISTKHHLVDEIADTRESIYDGVYEYSNTGDEDYEDDVILIPADKIQDAIDIMFVDADKIDEKWDEY